MLMEIFSAIKQTINGNLNKPLDVLIQEKTTEINAKVDGVNARVDTKASQTSISTLQSTANTIKSTVDTINQNSGSQNRAKVFKANGTFVVPSGVEVIYVTATAAGGDGGGSSIDWTVSDTYHQASGAGGASGECVTRYPIPVTAGQSIPITVGLGNTVIGTLLTLTKGGNGAGATGTLQSSTIGGHAGKLNGIDGGDGAPYNQVGLTNVNTPIGGSGALSIMGVYNYNLTWRDVIPAYGTTIGGTLDKNGNNAIKYGCGGSGAGGAKRGQTRVGGKGAQGVVIIEW